jgi:crossover junction endodeoxyribonuclease RuvC
MIILGVDTAIRCTGYGVIKMTSPNDIEIVDCGVIKNTQKMLHSECLRRISGGVGELIKTYTPDAVSIEDAFYGKNVKTAMILSLARGAAITAAATAFVDVYQYSPRSAKKAVTGTGTGTKEQIAVLLSSMLGINISEIPRDSTDALAIAICHGQLATRTMLGDLLPKPI